MPKFLKPKAIIIDIEGTTIDRKFVSKMLFPFIKNNSKQFLIETYEESDTKYMISKLRDLQNANEEGGPRIAGSGRDAVCKTVSELLVWMMNKKINSSELKQINLMCWFWGYKSSLLKSEVYSDVSIALHEWKNKLGIKICTYSSGLSIAQQLIFCRTNHGNIHCLIDQFFDKSIGDKKDSTSYELIAKTIGVEERKILFITDYDKEIKAAVSAGLKAALIKRSGGKSAGDVPNVPTITSFSEIRFD